MLKTYLVLMDELKGYVNPAAKIARMVKAGEIIRIKQGLYETDPHAEGVGIAEAIYGPSYLSFEYALSYHGLIPEAVYQYTSATFEKKRTKLFETSFGVFSYQDVPSPAFSLGVQLILKDDYSFRLATPEKALCDELYKLPPCANRTELEQLLFDNLRVDREAVLGLNLEELKDLSSLYQTKNHKLFSSWIRREQNKRATNSQRVLRRRGTRSKYRPIYSDRAMQLIDILSQAFPHVSFTVFETTLMNEFLNHLVAQNTVFIQAEKESSILLFRFLQEQGYHDLLYRPSGKDFSLYWVKDCIIVSDLISEAPILDDAPHSICLEKLLVDMYTDKLISTAYSKAEFPDVLQLALSQYQVDKAKMLRYARRRNRGKELALLLEGGKEAHADV